MSRRLWTQHLGEPARPAESATPAPAARRRPAPPSPPAPRRRTPVPRPTAEQLLALDASVPLLQVLDIDLMPKPRMTRRDRWLRRPCVVRYRQQCDHLRLAGLRLPVRYLALVFLPMPASWSLTRRRAANGTPMLSAPDVDNLCKGLQDALCPNDAHLWDGRLQKRWAWTGRLLLLKQPVSEADLDGLIAIHLPPEPRRGR